MKIGKRLEELRLDAGFNREDAAEKLNISKGTLSHWENDLREPSFDKLELLAQLYGVTVSRIFSDDDTDQSCFLNDVIRAMHKDGTLTLNGLADTSEDTKQLLYGVLDTHIKKLLK